jgi:hypothetical protein
MNRMTLPYLHDDFSDEPILNDSCSIIALGGKMSPVSA